MSKNSLLLSYALFSFSAAWAQPSQPHIVQGSADLRAIDSQTLEIHTAHRTKINWDDFSIAHGETTRFVQPSEASVVINQVTGLQRSEILGTLSANGLVYLINPQGIFIGPDAFIQTAGFVATTFDQLTLNEDGMPIHFKGDSKHPITHLGQIKTAGGIVTLVAAQIEHQGTTQGSDVVIASAPEVWIKPDEKGVYLIPQVSVQEIADAMDPLEFIIKQEGTVRATTCVENEGRIYLVSSQKAEVKGALKGQQVDVFGDQIIVSDAAHIDVSQKGNGGAVRIGGDYQGRNAEVPNASHSVVHGTLLANSLGDGNGGRVIVWGNKSCDFQGKIEGRGKNGGFVEISSPEGLNFQGLVDLKASSGKMGTLLLDPVFLSVGTVATSIVPTGTCPPGFTYTGVGPGVGYVNEATLGANLSNCNVTLQTTGGGDIEVVSAITGWGIAASTLTLISDGSVYWRWQNGVTTAHFTETENGSLNIQAKNDINIVIDPSLTAASMGFHTGSGSITMNAGGNIIFDDGQTANSNNMIGFMSETGPTSITAMGLQMTSLSTGGGLIRGIYVGLQPEMFTNFFGTIVHNPITFNIGGNVSISSNDGWIQIGNRLTVGTIASIASPITFTNITGNLQLSALNSGIISIGHSEEFSFVGPPSISGSNIVFNSIGGNVLIQENQGLISIGHTINQPTQMVNADILFQHVAGSFTMQDISGSPLLNGVFIGHTTDIGASPPYTLSGNIALNYVGGALELSGQNGYSFMGHWGLAQDVTVRGDITVQTHGGSPSIFIQSANFPLASGFGTAGIGHLGFGAAQGTNVTMVGPETISLLAPGGIVMQSRSTQAAYIGFFDPIPQLPLQQNVTIPSINITTNGGAPFNMSAENGLTLIGAQVTNSSPPMNCPINIFGNPNLSMTTTGSGAATIANATTASANNINVAANSVTMNAPTGSVSMIAGNNLAVTAATGSISLNAHSLLQAQANQTTIAGRNISLTNGAQMSAMTGSLDLVVDNINPSPGVIGTSGFTLDGSSALFAGGPTLKIYTAIRSQNSVQGLINGQTFVPGTLFANSSTERWSTYYPFAGLGVPFTFFYKNGPSSSGGGGNLIVFSDVYHFIKGSGEYLRDLERFDELALEAEPFDIVSEVRFQEGQEKKIQLVRFRRDYHLKWLEPRNYMRGQ